MRDLAPDDAAVRRRVEKGVGRVLASGGFARLDTPVLERSDLFIRKSGGEIAGSLYAFTDPGGVSVSLRPEFTPSIIRWHVENAPPDTGETRYRYSGPVFRYGAGARFRQFQQAGAEFIGVPGADGDFEILRTAIDCLQSAGADDFRVRIGHVGVLRDMLDSSGISERARMFILSNVAETTRGADGEARLLKKAAAAGLILDGRKDAPPPQSSRRPPVDAAKAAAATSPALAALEDSISGPTGRRSAEMILSRLVMRREQAASAGDFRAAIRNMSRLAGCADSADPRTALARAKTVLRDCGASEDSLGELEDTLDRLQSADGACESSINVDFSFVRGLAYYTGAVFEFAGADGGGAAHPLGGGGRYDDLVKAFGGADAPACGFALDLDELSLRIRAPDAANKAAR